MTFKQVLMVERRKNELLDEIDDLEDEAEWNDIYGHSAAAHIEAAEEEIKFLDKLLATSE